MTKLILDVPDQDMGDALNVYFQSLRDINRLKTKEQLRTDFRGKPFVITKNNTSVRVESTKK